MSVTTKSPQLPIIHDRQVVAKSRLFAIEQLSLEFSNGERREYERMKGSGRGAVMIVPINANGELLLVEEYAAGTHSYQLGFPKGLIDPGESPEEAANRELKEEIGLGARTLTPIHTVSLAPGFLNAPMYIFLAQDFYDESLPGDEPEPLTLVPWSLSDSESLLSQENFTEARSICALLFVQKLFAGKIHE